MVTPYLGAGGYLAKTKKIYNNDITNLNDQISNEQSQITKEGDSLRQNM